MTGFPVPSTGAVDVNPSTAIERNSREAPNTIAIRAEHDAWTYAQLQGRVHRLAAALADRGVGHDDRIAFLGPNSPSFFVTMLAAFELGAIFVPVNFRLAGPELARVLDISGARALVCAQSHCATIDSVRESTPLQWCLLVDDDASIPADADADPARWETLSSLPVPTVPYTPCPQGFDDNAILMFTSGTTGSPKGVILTHGNIWWNAVNVGMRLDTRRDDVTYAVAPLFHVGALNSFAISTLIRGGTVVVRSTFDPTVMLRDLVELEVNSLFAVPAMLAAFARVPGAFDSPLPQLRAVVVAGAPVPPSLVQRFADHGVWLQQAWGLTETAPFATHLPVERTLDKLGSAGTAMPYTQVRVVTLDTNEPVAPGVPGEIVVRGPNVTPGYWDNPEATSTAFDDDGWFHSGDIGYLDADGYLFIVDRLKDMVITGGENVYPAEVERALTDVPGVLDVAVVGTADPQWGETVVALVTVSAGQTIDLAQIRAHGAHRLARYKLPRHLIIVDGIPRNPTGKLDKQKIRAMVAHRLQNATE